MSSRSAAAVWLPASTTSTNTRIAVSLSIISSINATNMRFIGGFALFQAIIMRSPSTNPEKELIMKIALIGATGNIGQEIAKGNPRQTARIDRIDPP